jgi:hypothetical protein
LCGEMEESVMAYLSVLRGPKDICSEKIGFPWQ